MNDGFDAVELGTSYTTQGRTITEADVVNFAGVSGDFNHLHTDAAEMAASPVGERIAHGSLVFSVVTGLLWQSRPPEEREHLIAFYGVDNLRFIEPVFLGDTIHVRTEIVDKQERDHPLANGVVHQQVEAINQADETVQAAELLLVVR